MKETPRYWFPAKRYGWGWGWPQTWQGWLVLVVFLAVLPVGGYFFPPEDRPLEFGVVIAVDVVLVLVACALKGEPPRWRWGSD